MFKAEYLFYIIIEILLMDNFPLDLQDHIEIYDDYLETIDYNFNRYEKKTLDKFLDLIFGQNWNTASRLGGFT